MIERVVNVAGRRGGHIDALAAPRRRAGSHERGLCEVLLRRREGVYVTVGRMLCARRRGCRRRRLCGKGRGEMAVGGGVWSRSGERDRANLIEACLRPAAPRPPPPALTTSTHLSLALPLSTPHCNRFTQFTVDVQRPAVLQQLDAYVVLRPRLRHSR